MLPTPTGFSRRSKRTVDSSHFGFGDPRYWICRCRRMKISGGETATLRLSFDFIGLTRVRIYNWGGVSEERRENSIVRFGASTPQNNTKRAL